MNLVEKIIKELNLREPQSLALKKLDTMVSDVKLGKDSVKEIEARIVGNIKFDTEFPSFTFALATGIGKTKLMGAMISYLYHKKGLKNFFILTPGETIYTKTIENFSSGSKKYVLEGVTDLPPFNIVTGNNYTYSDFGNKLFGSLNIYIFNIQKIFNERKDVEFRFHKYQETLGSSFAELLQPKDLVILMDESHRYRGEQSIKAINHLKPELGLEFTATPISENVVYKYTLGEAIHDAKKALEKIEEGQPPENGYIKIPYIVARKDDYTYKGEVERNKLEDGIIRHRAKKILVEEYCKNNNFPLILPITLITTRSIDHASDVASMVRANDFFGGYYKDKTLVVTSKSEVDSINQLLHLEEPVPINKNEIVIHVDKLKEGWDIRSVYTIIPFRASISKTLIEQTIGRGLRLPFGQLTGVDELDSLEIISHDNFERVLNVAHEVAEGIGVKEAKPKEEMKIVEIKPTTDKKLLLRVPEVEAKVDSSNKLDFFPIKMNLDKLKKIKPELIRADIVTKETSKLETVRLEGEIDPVNRIVRLLIKEITEIDELHKEVLQKIVKRYLDQVKANKSLLSKLIKLHEQTILDDIIPQIKEKFQEQTKIEFKVLSEKLPFRSYFKSIKASSDPINWKEVQDSEIKGNIITGYQRSVFPSYTFDSTQEKFLADSLENDKHIKTWIKLITGQLPIRYIYGNYNPDFIVEKDYTYYLVEVKDKSKIDKKDPDVFAKAKKAQEWCNIASKATKHKWIYKLLPHTAMVKGNTFDAIISSAYKFG